MQLKKGDVIFRYGNFHEIRAFGPKEVTTAYWSPCCNQQFIAPGKILRAWFDQSVENGQVVAIPGGVDSPAWKAARWAYEEFEVEHPHFNFCTVPEDINSECAARVRRAVEDAATTV